jgi:hypothetical protein
MVSSLTPLITALTIGLALVPLVLFWARMYTHMQNNTRLPSLLSNDAKGDWTLVFVLLNIFGAIMYYAQVYRQSQ